MDFSFGKKAKKASKKTTRKSAGYCVKNGRLYKLHTVSGKKGKRFSNGKKVSKSNKCFRLKRKANAYLKKQKFGSTVKKAPAKSALKRTAVKRTAVKRTAKRTSKTRFGKTLGHGRLSELTQDFANQAGTIGDYKHPYDVGADYKQFVSAYGELLAKRSELLNSLNGYY